MYTVRCAQSSHALIYNISFIYKLLLPTLSAHWFKPPLNRTQWPPDPTLLPVADCQVGRSVCVVEKHKNMELRNAYKPYHYLLTLRHFTQNFDIPLEMNSNLLCHHWACWCGAPGLKSNAQNCVPSLPISLKLYDLWQTSNSLALDVSLLPFRLLLSVFLCTLCHSALPVPCKQTPSIPHQYAGCQRRRRRSSRGEEEGKAGKTKPL